MLAFLRRPRDPGRRSRHVRRATRAPSPSAARTARVTVQPTDAATRCGRRSGSRSSRRCRRIIARLRRVFDLAADPELIGAHLAEDPDLAPLVAARPGLRVPGAWDGFELAVRALLGQQITVAGAVRLAARLVAAFGEPVSCAQRRRARAHPRLPGSRRSSPIAICRASASPGRAAAALGALARTVRDEADIFGPRRSLDETIRTLRTLPGVGEWTAQYIAMREMREPDAFPAADVGLLRAMADGHGRRPSVARAAGPRRALAPLARLRRAAPVGLRLLAGYAASRGWFRSRSSSSAAFAQGGTRRDALDEARQVARHVESLGFRRIWVAEHHNMPTVTTAATSLVVAHLAAGTTTIRVGAGGIMLPNHAPYVIAEQFGTLATLFPGRIDLGLGRAPGTDQQTLAALRRLPTDAEHFPQDVLELQAFLAPVEPGQRIEAVPGSGTEVPIYILGSSLFGAQLAAELGLPVRVRVALLAAAARRGAGHLSRALQALAAARRPARDGRRQRHRRRHRRRGAPAGHVAADVLHQHPARRPRPHPAADRRHRRLLAAAREVPRVADAGVQRRRERRDGAPRPRRAGRADAGRRADRRVGRLRLRHAPAILRADRRGRGDVRPDS